jgi:tetratricopeptide (TPR) repeat protein
MLGLGWFAARQAQEALKAGRLEEVQRLLDQPGALSPKRALDIKQQLAAAYVERGRTFLRRLDATEAWQELAQAEALKTSHAGVSDLREELAKAGLAELRRLLEVGKPARAVELADQLRDHGVDGGDFDGLEEAARNWVRAEELADRGEFSQASVAIEALQRLFPGVAAIAMLLDQFLKTLTDRRQSFDEIFDKLLAVAPLGRWGEVLQLCDRILAVAPAQPEARRLRSQAWRALEPATVITKEREAISISSTADKNVCPTAPRFLLWIDGVGGYLVCLGNRITLGQASPEAQVDVPLFADVSRQHATLTRDSEGYLLETVRTVSINGKTATRTLLQDGDRVTLGTSCQFLFHQPVPVSATARLDLVSGHRLKLAVDAVLLMADSLVLGPGPDAHIALPDVKAPVVLYRHKDGLGIRAAGKLVVNGEPCQEHGILGADATVQGDDFSLAIEAANTV